ncbi:putative lipid II flippase FtsW [uncultured Pseudoteredinibacter sp.]|uniref:putative lipid II flippase FtsW n=1 Tax=uncultured Pseudoteredinibacter sp. TaxID=1641701 RepID=UPI00260240DE|nr:putative lipid II flippase FtsW [uncultured Pseudoteredinibacter sp.]
MTELAAVKLPAKRKPKVSKQAASAYASPAMASVDWPLLTLLWAIVSCGIILVASSSVSIADSLFGDSLHFAKRHTVYIVLGMIGACFIAALPSQLWRRYGPLFLLLALILLTLVLVPGLGKRVNGSQRWFNLGFITVQASEVVKFCVIVFFASYLSRRQEDLLYGWKGFGISIASVVLIAALLILEPDFGSTVVITVTAMSMLFLAGVRLHQFLLLVLLGAGGLAVLATATPYRLQRLVSYLDPWADQYGGGYQLTQSLIAFGRGEWFGSGLGNSIQKLFYLPEAHTDFIFAILAEEFGLLGVLLMLGLFVAFIARILGISRRAMAADDKFAALACFGVAAMFSTQVLINVGVASGFLPTKGLTLPFVSWGGSSLIANFALIGFILRLDWELRRNALLKPKVKRMPRKKTKAVEELAA